MESLSAFRTTDPGHDSPEGFALARGIGLGSIGVGLAELAVPRAIVRAKGAGDVALGLGILLRPRRPLPMWLRVAGDALGIAALAWALRDRERRAWFGGGLLASVAALGFDLWASRKITRAQEHASRPVMASVSINRPPEEVYAAFRRFSELPTFMRNLVEVSEEGDRSRWTAKLPGGKTVEWDAEITEDRAGELIAWRAIGPSKLHHRGQVTFARMPGGEGTEVRVMLALSLPGVAPSATLARLFTKPQMKGDLRRFKEVLECGEVLEVWP